MNRKRVLRTFGGDFLYFFEFIAVFLAFSYFPEI